jgi:hypothetical protein
MNTGPDESGFRRDEIDIRRIKASVRNPEQEVEASGAVSGAFHVERGYPRNPNPESRNLNPESRIQNPESRNPNPESRVPKPEF